MHDRKHPDHACVFAVATTQMGCFTAAQARECGFSWDGLTRHVQSGRFNRVRRGLYRVRDYPSTPREEIMAARLSLGSDAVVSHESALELLGLSTVIPNAIHITVPRSRRYVPQLPGVAVHTTTRPIAPDDRIIREGIPITAPARAIIDTAAAGIGPEQVEMAVEQALERELTTREDLECQATRRDSRVQQLISRAITRKYEA